MRGEEGREGVVEVALGVLGVAEFAGCERLGPELEVEQSGVAGFDLCPED